MGEAHAAGLFCGKRHSQKTGMGPADAIAHFLQTKHRKKARHGALFFIKNCWRAGRAVVSSLRPCHCFFCKTRHLQKTGMGPAHAIAHFLQTKRREKARHGALFFIKNCWRAGQTFVS
ncbi:MAG TPA: hypothetical protein VG077_08330 [Verrucomicrobiae bacterium]|nr:hypothetical protein [Verrucomicrobiae bacterium]